MELEATPLYRQLAVTRDELIDDLDGAIKYEPIMRDMMVGRDPQFRMSDEDLAGIKLEAQAIAEKGHAELIGRLREELIADPEKLGYAGRRPEEIIDLMSAQREVDGAALRTRWSVCNSSIPYCRNVLRAEEIKEALQ